MSEKAHRCDVLVVGSGLAGLRAAMQAAEQGLKTVVASLGSGASPNVFGFSALNDDSEVDSYEIFRHDLMRSGGDINDPELVDALINGSRTLVSEAAALGYHVIPSKRVGKRGGAGHSVSRGNASDHAAGPELQRLMREVLLKKGVEFWDGTEILFPILSEGRVVGAAGIDSANKEEFIVRAKAVVLACGGIGSLVYGSSYPQDVKAGYVPFALLAGAEIADMEFVQTEPCTCMTHPAIRNMPVPCGLFSEGAKLLNANGEHFIEKYGYESEGGLLKSILVRAITKEIQEGRGTPEGGVYYDARAVAEHRFAKFESKSKRLAKAGLSFKNNMLVVRPGPHSHMGGVLIDVHCSTGIDGLYAAGESASGVHGAARMAGCGGTTALVFGKIAGKSAAQYVTEGKCKDLSETEWSNAVADSVRRAKKVSLHYVSQQESIQTIEQILAEAMGMERDADTLTAGLRKLHDLYVKGAPIKGDIGFEYVRVFGAAAAAQSLLTAALLREETRGCHYRTDFPKTCEKWMARIAFCLNDDDALVSRIIPC